MIPSDIELALQRVGELLEAQEVEFALVVAGGAALNLHGIVQRSTSDVDVIALAKPGEQPARLSQPPRPLPEPLVRAIRTVARDLNLTPDWINAESAMQWRFGLPEGIDRRIEWRNYRGLSVGLVGRYDLIFFKLFAATDIGGPAQVHYQDLLALAPTPDELDAAARWVATQDAGPSFHDTLARALVHARRDLGHSTDPRDDR